MLFVTIFPVVDTLVIREVNITVKTKKGDYRLNPALLRTVRDLVINPEDVVEPDKACDSASYILITKNEFLSGFSPLILWKTKKGTPARGVSLEWIYENFPASDSAQSIRDYIRYAYENLGTEWVLLGGDAEIIPAKMAYAMVDTVTDITIQEGYVDSVPSDLFYSDLFSPWDSCDMLPEVFVGRAPVSTSEDVDVFVEKVLRYEREPDSTYAERAFFLGFPLDDGDDFATVKQYIGDHLLPPMFGVSYGTGDIPNTLTELNLGYHLVNYGGCGDYDRLDVGGEFLTSTLVDGLVNSDRLSLVYTIASYSGGFHR